MREWNMCFVRHFMHNYFQIWLHSIFLQRYAFPSMKHTPIFDGANWNMMWRKLKTALRSTRPEKKTKLILPSSPFHPQVGRSSESPIDFVVMDTLPGDKKDAKVLQSTISRFACRILVDRTDGHKARIYAAGFDSSRNIFLGVGEEEVVNMMVVPHLCTRSIRAVSQQFLEVAVDEKEIKFGRKYKGSLAPAERFARRHRNAFWLWLHAEEEFRVCVCVCSMGYVVHNGTAHAVGILLQAAVGPPQ